MRLYSNSCLRGQVIDYLFHLLVTLIFFSSFVYIASLYYKKFDEIKGTIITVSFLNFLNRLPRDPSLYYEIKIKTNFPVFMKGDNICTSYGKVCFFTYHFIKGILSEEIILRGEEIELK